MTEKPFKPLLSATIESAADLRDLSYPLIMSPKVDGIRCLCHPSCGPSSRSMKPIANKYVRQLLSHPTLYNLDGELWVGELDDPRGFQNTTSGIMSQSGTPDFTYWVFDWFGDPLQPYKHRVMAAKTAVKQYQEACEGPIRVRLLEWEEVVDAQHVDHVEENYIQRKYEGAMLRHPMGPYKNGRSTLKQQILMKLKRFADDEATVKDFEPLYRNNNQATTDALGHTVRSAHTANLVADDLLGALIVDHPKWGVFNIGSGFDVPLRQEIWKNKEKYRGRKITFKYQQHGMKDKPRIPIFKGFRGEE